MHQEGKLIRKCLYIQLPRQDMVCIYNRVIMCYIDLSINMHLYLFQGNIIIYIVLSLLIFHHISHIMPSLFLSTAPTTALPIGESSLLRERGLPMMLASSDLESAIMAVSSATTSDDVVGSPVCGYVHVKTVDTETRTIIAMAPTNDPPEGNRFIVGTLKWFDES